MGAGISDKALYGRLYRRLHGILREMRKRFGEACNMRYENRSLVGDVAGVACEVYYSMLRASNGECAGMPCVAMAKASLFDDKVNERLPWGKDPVDYVAERLNW